MSDDARFDPRFDPAFQPGYVGPPASTPTAQAPAQAAAVPSPPAALPEVVNSAPQASLDDSVVVNRPNPFIIVLGVVSLLLVGGGFYFTAQLRQIYYSAQQESSGFDFSTFQVLIYAIPLMISLGIATAIGIMFMLAARWSRLRR